MIEKKNWTSWYFAEVLSIDSGKSDVNDTAGKEIVFTAQIFGDENNVDKRITCRQILNENTYNTEVVSVGDKVVLLSYGDEYLFQYFYRFDKIVILILVFCGLLLLLGGLKGFHTIISLGLTCLSIFLVFIPSIIAGFNIYISTVVISFYIILVTLTIVYGLNKKSLAAAFSCFAGVAFSGILCLLMDRWMKLTGYINDNIYMLNSLFGFNVDVKAIMFAMITIGALGAIMDVSMSIASSLNEIKEKNRSIGAREIIKSGFHIGRDIMGTMANTLILAYIGSSLVVVLVYASSHYQLLSILNKEEIIFEFLQSLIGSLSFMLTIPFTAAVFSMLLSKKRSRRRSS